MRPQPLRSVFSGAWGEAVDAGTNALYHKCTATVGVAGVFHSACGVLKEFFVIVSSLVAAYLFLGGAGAGAFVFATALIFLAGRRNAAGAGVRAGWCAKVAHRGFVVSVVLIVFGILCLVFDLGRPDQLLLLFRYPTLSFLSSGAYALALLVVCGSALIFLSRFDAARHARRAAKVVAGVGTVVALYVMVYTGLLLRAVNVVPLWDSALLPVLFVLSSLASGAACTVLCARLIDDRFPFALQFERKMSAIDVALMALEAVVAAAYVAFATAHPLGAESVDRLLLGDVAPLFLGGFAVCGLLLPAAFDASVLCGRSREWTTFAAALLSLVGCFCLRLSLVCAGVHSAVG